MMTLRKCLPPWHHSPGYNTIPSQHIRLRWQNICWIQWWYPSSKGSGTVAGALPATSGKTWSTRVYHRSTQTNWGASTPHWKTAATGHDTSTMHNLQTCGWTQRYNNIAVHRYTVTDKPHHDLTPRYPHFWLMRHHPVRGLVQWYWNSSGYFKGEMCPAWPRPNQLAWPTPFFVRHFKLGNAGMTSEIYFIWNSVMQTYTCTHHILWRCNRRKMRHWQNMCIISKWKLRVVTSTVTLLPYAFLSSVSRMHKYHIKGVWKGILILIGGYQTGGETQQGTTGYSYLVNTYG